MLLSFNEYFKFKNIIPLIKDWWWLKDAYPGCDRFVYCVDDVGALCVSRRSNILGVRPALRMSLTNDNSLGPGDKIKIGNKNFTILSWEKDELFALCNESLITRRFDANNNEWKTSELKEWLETEGLKLIF